MLSSGDDVPRKHRVQMTQPEIVELETVVHTISNWRLKSHLVQRASEKNFSEAGIRAALRVGQLIEARPDGRVVMRHDGYCVVANINNGIVITCWRNDDNDTHSTLNLKQYQWRGNAMEALQHVR